MIEGWKSCFPGSGRHILSRKYVDLIVEASSWWATYSPFRTGSVQVGDFGIIEEETGEFVYHGNIYTNEAILESFPDLRKDTFRPHEGAVINKWIITSKNARQSEATAGPKLNLAGIIEASIDVEVSFSKDRGAFLLMYRPQTTTLPRDIVLEQLSRIPELRQKDVCLVTEVVRCPAYALQLSDKGARTTRVKFVGQLPVPNVPGVTAGGEVGFGWKTEHISSSYQEGINVEGEPVYCPLYSLKQVRRRSPFRQAESEKSGDDTWVDVMPPWAPLDEDGNEQTLDEDDED